MTLSKKAKALAVSFTGALLDRMTEEDSTVEQDDVEQILIDNGLLEDVQTPAPCGEICQCAEEAEFPTVCRRFTAEGRDLVAAYLLREGGAVR